MTKMTCRVSSPEARQDGEGVSDVECFQRQPHQLHSPVETLGRYAFGAPWPIPVNRMSCERSSGSRRSDVRMLEPCCR